MPEGRHGQVLKTDYDTPTAVEAVYSLVLKRPSSATDGFFRIGSQLVGVGHGSKTDLGNKVLVLESSVI